MAPVRKKNSRKRRRKRPLTRKARGSKRESERSLSSSSTTRHTLPQSDVPLEENCYEKDPVPSGYTFVRKGDVYITRNCRSKTKESTRTVYVVYTRPKQARHTELIPIYIQDPSGKRTLGLRIPTDIVADVLSSAATTAASRADAVQRRDHNHSTRARNLLRTQFPHMPPASVEKIVDHAFLKGSRRVGRSTRRSLSDEKKAALAVEAHIRHLHTPYEELMSEAGLSREEARREVWATVLAVKKMWQGHAVRHETESTSEDVVDLELRERELGEESSSCSSD